MPDTSISDARRYSWWPWLSDFTEILIKLQPWTADRSIAGLEIPVSRSSCVDAVGVRRKALRFAVHRDGAVYEVSRCDHSGEIHVFSHGKIAAQFEMILALQEENARSNPFLDEYET